MELTESSINTTQIDAVVIGSGAGGAAVVWRLIDAGLRVLLLEAGPRFVPSRDYPLSQPGWERQRFPVLPGSRAQVLYGDLGHIDLRYSDLARFNASTPQQIQENQREPSHDGYAHVQGVGGSTLHYVGEAHRMHPESLALHHRTGFGSDWPVGYATLEPYYARAEDIIGVAGPVDPGVRWRSGPYPQPPHPLSPAAMRLSGAAKQLGWDWAQNPRAVLSQPRDERPACNYCGHCSRGCPIGDKGSSDVTCIAPAEATGRLRVITNATVTALYQGRDGRITELEYQHEGRRHRQETPLLFLCAGAVQTPRLLLAGHNADQPAGLANSSGQVGQNFMETLSYVASGLAPDLHYSQRGLPADAISWQFNAPDAVPDVAGGFRLGSAVQEVGLNGPIAYGTRLLRGHGSALKTEMRRTFGSALSVSAVGEVIPDARSYVALSKTQRDKFNMPLPVINSVLTDNSLALLNRMAESARLLLAQAGVREIIEQYSSWDRFTATHVFGTCRMGNDSTRSVTDSFGRTHDHANLFIADASLFPSSGGGEGPMLTITALGLRAADHALSG